MSPSLLSTLFLQLGLVASPITITEVGASREGERLAITIKADAAIAPESATPKVTGDGHLYLYVHDARVTEGNRAWGDGPAEIRAHRHKHQVELVVPLGEDGCRGAVEIVKSPDGLRALVSCDEPAPRAKAPRTFPSALASAPTLAAVAPRAALVVVEPKVSLKAPAKLPAKADAPIRAPEREVVALKAALVLQPPVARESAPKTSRVTAGVVSPPPASVEMTPEAASPAAAPTLPAVQSSSAGGGRSGGIVLAGLLLCGLAGGAFVFARRRAKGSRYVTIIETASLGPKRAIIVARIGGATMILGSSEAGITVLQSLRESPEAGAGRAALASRGAGATTRDAGKDDQHDPDVADSATDAGGVEAGTVPSIDDELDEQPGQAGLLARFFKPAATANGSSSAQSFESLLEDSLEDQELRRKLSLGLAGRTR